MFFVSPRVYLFGFALALVVESHQFCRCVTCPFTLPLQQSYTFFLQEKVVRMPTVSECLISEWMSSRSYGWPFYKLHACHSDVDCLRRIGQLNSVIKWQCQGFRQHHLLQPKTFGTLTWQFMIVLPGQPPGTQPLNSSRPLSEKLISVFLMTSFHLWSITHSQDAPLQLHA